MKEATDSHLMSLAGLTSLRNLNLEGNYEVPFGNKGMKSLADLSRLESLKINVSMVTGSGMAVLPNFKDLRRLELANIPRVTAQGLANIRELKQLRSLHLHLRFDVQKGALDRVLPDVKTLTELEELSIDGTLTDGALRQLVGLKKLRVLDLTSTRGYTDDALAALMSELPNLEVVKRNYEPLPGQTK